MSIGYLAVCTLRGCLKKFGPSQYSQYENYPMDNKSWDKSHQEKQQQNLPKVVILVSLAINC